MTFPISNKTTQPPAVLENLPKKTSQQAPSTDTVDKLRAVSANKVVLRKPYDSAPATFAKLFSYTMSAVFVPLFRAIYHMFVKSAPQQQPTSPVTVSEAPGKAASKPGSAQTVTAPEPSASEPVSTSTPGEPIPSKPSMAPAPKKDFEVVFKNARELQQDSTALSISPLVESPASPALKELYKELYDGGHVDEDGLKELAATDIRATRSEDLSKLLANPAMEQLIKSNSAFFLLKCNRDVIHRLMDPTAIELVSKGKLTVSHIATISQHNDDYTRDYTRLLSHPLHKPRLLEVLGGSKTMEDLLPKEKMNS